MNWLATIWAEARRGPVLAVLWVLAAAFVAYVFVTGGYLIAHAGATTLWIACLAIGVAVAAGFAILSRHPTLNVTRGVAV